MTPKLRHGAFLAFFIARIETNGTSPQGIHQQTIHSAGSCREQVIPSAPVTIQARRGHEPVERIKVSQISFPVNRLANFLSKQREGTLEMMFERGTVQGNGGKLHAAEVKQQLRLSRRRTIQSNICHAEILYARKR